MRKPATMTTAIAEAIIDPVCGMNLPPGKKDLVAHYEGCSFYFCAEACRKAFDANPQNYLEEPKPSKREGWCGRYLEQLNKTNRTILTHEGRVVYCSFEEGKH